LVTGATGRVGRHLVKALLDRGESVRVLVKNGTADSELVEVFYGDILNKESLRKAVDGVDTIYHLAAVVDYTAPKDLMFNVNVIGTKNLLEVSAGRKIIYLSSAAVMGRNFKELPVSESTPCHPSNYYGETKLEAEKLVREAGGIIIRSPDIMGQGFTEGFDYVISKIADGTMVIPGDGKNFIQFVHISDLVQALILAKEIGKSGEVYIVTGKEIRTLNECFALIAKYLGVDPPKKHVSKLLALSVAGYKSLKSRLGNGKQVAMGEYIEKMAANRSFDISKAKSELGYISSMSYDDIMEEMIINYRKSHEQKEDIPDKDGKDQGQGKD